MIRTPAHKQTDPAKAAGQIKTLGEYIDQKTAHDPKKLSFDEWYAARFKYAKGSEIHLYLVCKDTWDASRANL